MGNGKDNAVRLLTAAALVLALGSAGCATKGFVRSQVKDVRTEMQTSDETLKAEIGVVRNSGEEALARADAASGLAGEARNLALGKVGYREESRYSVNFAFDSDELNSEAMGILDEVAVRILAHPEFLVDVYGYTDTTGPDRYNIQLGQRRADMVMRHLTAATPGHLSRFAAISYGEMHPVDASEKSASRRVEVALIERIPTTGVQQTAGSLVVE